MRQPIMMASPAALTHYGISSIRLVSPLDFAGSLPTLPAGSTYTLTLSEIVGDSAETPAKVLAILSQMLQNSAPPHANTILVVVIIDVDMETGEPLNESYTVAIPLCGCDEKPHPPSLLRRLVATLTG